MTPDEDPLEQLKALKVQTPDPLDELKKLKPAHRAPKTGQMGHPIVDADPEPNDDREVLGGIASLAHDIPGAEALQAMAGMRSLNLMKPEDRAQFIPAYKESLANLRGAEASTNPWLRRFNNIVGGTVAAAATPGSTVARQGARFGVAEALGSADPENLKERIDKIPVRAGVDAIAGKVFGELLPTAARVVGAKSLGKNVLDRTAAMEAADVPTYGKAKIEGDLAAANPTPAAVTNALNDPDIQPYVKTVRASGLFSGANDATVLREAYKLMSEKERTLGTRIAASDDYKAGSELERNEITAGKKKLLGAGSQVMPSFRPAVTQHAVAEGNIDALKSAADATKRIYSGGDVAGKNIATKSPEQFMASILTARKAEAQAMREGVLGKLQKKSGLSGNPFTAFGVPKTLYRLNSLTPYINALDARAGDAAVPFYMRAAGIALGAQTH